MSKILRNLFRVETKLNFKIISNSDDQDSFYFLLIFMTENEAHHGRYLAILGCVGLFTEITTKLFN